MCPGWKKICCMRDTPTPPLSAPCIHVCRWWHMRLMDPLCSPQPGTSTLAWCPPAEYKGVAYWQGSPPLKLGVTAGEADFIVWSTGSGTTGPVDSVMGTDGRWWWMRYGRFSCEGVGLRIGRNVTLLPSEAHRNPPPLNLPLPTSIFPNPSVSRHLASTVWNLCRPPPSGNQPFSAESNPWKIKGRREYRSRNIKGSRMPYEQNKQKETREWTNLQQKPPCLLLQMSKNTLPLAPNYEEYQCPPPLWFGVWALPHQWTHLPRKRGKLKSKIYSKDMLRIRKKMYAYKWITRKMRGMRGVLPELWTVASPPGPTIALPSGSSSSTSPTISLSFSHLANVKML